MMVLDEKSEVITIHSECIQLMKDKLESKITLRLQAEGFTFDVRPLKFGWIAGMILAGASNRTSWNHLFCDIQHLMSERQDKIFVKLSESLFLRGT